MSKLKLNKDEKKLEVAFEAGEYQSVLTDKRKKQIRQSAIATFKKDKRINIRISSKDLEALQKRAMLEGIGYQTLVSSILHKYLLGNLQDITAEQFKKS